MPEAPHHAADILLALFTVYVAALIGGELASRVKLPAVVGEILAGTILGPSVVGLIDPSAGLKILAELGAIFLLFEVGLETRLSDIRAVGATAVRVGMLGVLLPFGLAFGWAATQGFRLELSLFVAVAFVATSVGITARVLQEQNALGRIESRVILGAAVIDDILAMLLLGVVVAFQGGTTPTFGSVALVTLKSVAFVGLVAYLGGLVLRRASNALDWPVNPLSPLTIVLAICLGLAAAAHAINLAAIIGAFLAGMIAAETRQRHQLVEQTKPIAALLAPFFFVVSGALIDLRQLGDARALLAVAALVVVAVVGKGLGCGLGALNLGRRSAAIVGTGMVPQGEVGIIIASLGASFGLFEPRLYSIIVTVILITSVAAPPVLNKLLAGHPEPTAETEVDDALH